VWDLEVKRSCGDLNLFQFDNCTGYRKIIVYHSIEEGGHIKCIDYGWYNIQEGGHQHYITSYKNGQLHGIQYEWSDIHWNARQYSIRLFKNGQRIK
jgi:hypothetical protein